MPQKQIARRHHYIPEFYLKRWASGGRLVEYSKPYQDVVKAQKRYPKQTGWIDRLYALEGVPDEDSAAFEEEFLSPVDSRAADVLNKMEANVRGFSSAERVAWAQFMLSLVFRHPENVQAIKERLGENLLIVDRLAERRWRNERGPKDPTTLAEALKIEAARNPASISRRGLQLIAEMMASEKIGTHVINMKWGTIPMPPGVPALLTSDRPIHWFGGLKDKDCYIMMPVGTKRLFWATNTMVMADTIRSVHPLNLCAFMNSQTTRRAVKYVYAMSDAHVAYVQEFMGINPEVTLPDMITRRPPQREIRLEKQKLRANAKPSRSGPR